jgi:RNA polymerase II elongation factor ELL
LKKSELFSRLNNEGFKDIDKKELGSILNSISQLKDNMYHLSKNAWNEVHVDWTHYTSDEKELVKRRNPLIAIQPNITQTHTQNGISPLSDCGSMQAFPSPMSMDCSSPSKSPSISKRSAESGSTLAKRHRGLVTAHQSFNANAIKSPSNKLQTNGYHDVLNGWANKPSSPETIESNRVSTLMANTTDLKAVDSSLNNASHSSPDSNGICSAHEPFQSLQSNRVVNFITNDSNYVKKNSRDTLSRYNTNGFHVTSNPNGSGSINSSPNSSPDSGTGSHDGSTLSSSNSYSCTNDETADYLS